MVDQPSHRSFPSSPQLKRHIATCLHLFNNRLIVAADSPTIDVYDLRTGQLQGQLNGHASGVWALACKGDVLVTGSTDATVRVWDLKEMKEICTLRGHTSTVRCLGLSQALGSGEDGKIDSLGTLIVSGSSDGDVRVWRLPDQARLTGDSVSVHR
jgi:F-box and WD-40 domain protein CDC4